MSVSLSLISKVNALKKLQANRRAAIENNKTARAARLRAEQLGC